jgi:hypothetical protein
MEERLRDIESKSFTKVSVVEILGKLEDAASVAAGLRDKADVLNENLQRALDVVENFLREKGRPCYGGMAINAHLPKVAQFYDLTKVLPDYDFFSAEAEADAHELKRRMVQEGLPAPAVRPGMHEGTFKVFVDYTAVADCTQIPEWLYKLLVKRSLVIHGIHYTDANFLRMQMYLELSRPRGEVERWSKVYKRLLLLNKFAPPHGCKERGSAKKSTIGIHGVKGTSARHKASTIGVKPAVHRICMDYALMSDVVYASANLRGMYEKPARRQTAALVRQHVPIIAYVDEPKLHARALHKLLDQRLEGRHTLKTVAWEAQSDVTPALMGVLVDGRLAAVFVDIHGCISYNVVKVKGRELKIASLDALIYLYFVLSYVRGLDGAVPHSFLCAAEELVRISGRTRDSGREGVYAPFALTCKGHQTRKASLIREKVERGLAQKKKKGTRRWSGKSK